MRQPCRPRSHGSATSFARDRHGVGAQRHEEGVVAVVAVVLAAAERDGEVEAEAVDVALLHPVAQRVEDHPRHDGVRQVEGVAASGDVDVATATVDAVVGALVEPSPREGHVLPGVLGRVVVDDVEQHLDAGGVQVLDHRLELVEGALRVGRRRVRRVRREEAERVVAPVVRQPAQHEVGLVREGVDRQQLDGGDTQPEQVVDERGMGQAGIRAAELLGDAGVQLRGVLDVHLVDQRLGE